MRFFRYILKVVLITLFLLLTMFWGIVVCGKDYFYPSYQSVIQDKYRLLMDTNEPKIVLVGGSNLAFGINQEMLEQVTGYKVVNLGLHAGFGYLFISELSKANINSGDIVLLAYEHEWQKEDGFDEIGTDLVMSGIDNHIGMYKYIPMRKWISLIGYLPTYADKKCNYEEESGQYSRQAFDANTYQMTWPREYELVYDLDKLAGIDITDVYISDKSKSYLMKYKIEIENKGASVYFVAPPMVVGSLRCDKLEFERLKELEEAEIGISYISDPVDYILPSEYMNDSMWHCNEKGEVVRTQMLIDDLRKANVIE